MVAYKYRSLAAELALTATGVAPQQSRHFRTALGGESRELLAAVRATTRAVMASDNDLAATRLDDLPAMLSRGILEKIAVEGVLTCKSTLRSLASLHCARTR